MIEDNDLVSRILVEQFMLEMTVSHISMEAQKIS